MAGAVIRANRAEVSDRFPMLGFTVKTGTRPYFEAVITTDPALLDPARRADRTAATFWSSRELGPLPAERGEAVFIVPDLALRRFAGAERLYYAVATFADRTRSNPEVIRFPAGATPYVSLSPSYGGRRGRQMVGGQSEARRWNGNGARYTADNPQALEWAGDAVRPGSEPAKSNGNGNGNDAAAPTTAAASLAYDDGFGEALWREGRRPSRSRGLAEEGAFDLGWSDVPVVAEEPGVPGWLAAAAMLAGWIDPQTADPARLLQRLGNIAPDVTAGPPRSSDIAEFATLLGFEPEAPAQYTVDTLRRLLAARGPLWIGRAGPDSRFVVVTGIYGDGSDGATYVRLNDPSSRPLGAGLSGGEPRATGSSYVLTFRQFLDAFAAPGPESGLQAIHVSEAAMQGRTPLITSQAYTAPAASRGNGVARAQAVPAVVPIATAIVGATMNRILNNEGDISWELDQLRGLKHPEDDAARATGANYRTVTTPVKDWPKVLGGIHEIDALTDEIYADFEIEWQCNGHSLGNVAIRNTHTNDALGHGLEVHATINNDNTVYEGDIAGLRVTFHYRFTRSIGSDAIALREFTLYGDGTVHQESRWTQAPDGWWGAEEQGLSRAYEGGGAAVVGEIVKEAVKPAIEWVRSSLEDDIDLKLPRMKEWKHLDNDPANARPATRNHKTVTVKAPQMLVTYPVPFVDDRPISCDLLIGWDYDGSSLGNISVRPTNVNDPPGGGLNVEGEDEEDPPRPSSMGGQCVVQRLLFNYNFTFEFDSQERRNFDVVLYGDGRHEVVRHD